MPTYLVSGDDERLISARLSELVNELVGDADRSSVYESYDLAEVQADDRETMVRQVVNAAQTQSLFSDRRVVVVRNVDTTPLDSAPLVDYLRAPADYCHLVFTAKGKVGKALNDAMKKSGTA
ncbi:MAG: polymerase delta subunit, partial [Actinomycetota bacterium]